jgi:NAD(P)H-dependent FMN reductase
MVNVVVIVGSLRRESINRKLAKALTRLEERRWRRTLEALT